MPANVLQLRSELLSTIQAGSTALCSGTCVRSKETIGRPSDCAEPSFTQVACFGRFPRGPLDLLLVGQLGAVLGSHSKQRQWRFKRLRAAGPRPPRRQTSPSDPAFASDDKVRVALEARHFLRSQGNTRYGSFLRELKRRGVTVTTELYHRVEPFVLGSAHAQVASAYGAVLPPPVPNPAGPAVAKDGAKSRGSQSELTREGT